MKLQSKIVPHLWFDKEAREAAQFYCSVFPNSKVEHVTTLKDTPSGDCDVVYFTLAGQPFMAISAGPLFRFNESISFMIHCESQQEIDYSGESSPRTRSPSSAAGSRTGSACPGRSCRP